jgi:replicative DNA helicase
MTVTTPDAEIAVLGSCMVGDEQALVKALAVVRPEYFDVSEHQAIFGAIEALHRQGKPVDAVTVSERMPVEDRALVFQVVSSVPTALHVDHYAELVRQGHLRRRFRGAAARAMADPGDDNAMDAMLKAAQDLQADRAGVVSLGQVLQGYPAILDDRATRRVRVYKTGFPTLDRLNQMSPGTLAVVGARSSHGKTAMMLGWALHMAKAGVRVLFESCEMTDVELTDRIIAAESNLNSIVIRSDKVRGVMGQVMEASSRVHGLPLMLRQGGKINRATIESDIEVVRPDVVFLDYLQIIDMPERVDNRAAYFSDVANGLKRLATRKKVLIVTGSQFNRGIDHRVDAKPTMADYKESGGIEQAADLAFGIHIKLDRTERINVGELLLMKNRNGPCLDIPIRLVMGTTTFNEVADEAPPL